MNGVGLGFLFVVSIPSGDHITIDGVCTNHIDNSITVTTGIGTRQVGFTATACGAGLNCGGVTATVKGTLVIDCNNLSCLTFTDTTGGYTLSNTTGYGSPNSPAIADILSTTFNLWDSTGTTLIGSFNSSYIPSAGGNTSICLTPANFGLSSYTAGVNYILDYQLNLEGSAPICKEANFVFPCCGNPIASNLTTRFTVQAAQGCGSVVFTDTTGAYNVSTNPGGYGTPNPGYSDITATLISILLSNGQTVNITSFIPTALNPSLTILAGDLGYGSGPIPDQIMTVTYSVFTAGQCRVGYNQQQMLMTCNSDACIAGKITKLLTDDCGCPDQDDENKTDNLLKMLFELDAIKIAAQGNIGCVQGKIEAFYQNCSGGCSNC